MRALVLAACLLLGGCGTMEAYRARHELVGASEPDIISCMGVPSGKQLLGTDQSVLQWDYNQSGTDLDLELGIYALKLGRPGVCRAAMRFDRGTLMSVHYAGVDVNPTNPDSICGRLVKDCLAHREHTPLPPGFSNLAVLTGAPLPAHEGARN